MIRKTFSYIDMKMLSILYMTFIRPEIKFAAPVWSPSLKGDIEEIESSKRICIPGAYNLSINARGAYKFFHSINKPNFVQEIKRIN